MLGVLIMSAKAKGIVYLGGKNNSQSVRLGGIRKDGPICRKMGSLGALISLNRKVTPVMNNIAPRYLRERYASVSVAKKGRHKPLILFCFLIETSGVLANSEVLMFYRRRIRDEHSTKRISLCVC